MIRKSRAPKNAIYHLFYKQTYKSENNPRNEIVLPKQLRRIEWIGEENPLVNLSWMSISFNSCDQSIMTAGTAFKRSEVETWLTAAGMKNVQVACAGENCCAQSCCGKDHAAIRIFIASSEK